MKNLYGFGNDDEIDLRKANYFFRLSASEGYDPSILYSSFMTYFYLDENIIFNHYFQTVNKKHGNKNLKDFSTQRIETKSKLETYFGSIHNNI